MDKHSLKKPYIYMVRNEKTGILHFRTYSEKMGKIKLNYSNQKYKGNNNKFYLMRISNDDKFTAEILDKGRWIRRSINLN